MTWEYLIGSEKDFEGAPDWCTHVSGGGLSVAGSAWEEGSVAMAGKRYQWIGGECEQFYDNAEAIKLNIVAQRRKRESKQWDGVGMPPVGCECEAFTQGEWRKVKVAFYGDDLRISTAGKLVVIDLENTYLNWADKLRPLRTKEQIEMDEMENDLAFIIGKLHHGSGIEMVFLASEMHKKGYRKTK